MVVQLSPELQHALHASQGELEIVDPSTNQRYVIVAKDRWLGGSARDRRTSHDAGGHRRGFDSGGPWTDEKNRRRAELVDRQIVGTLGDEERSELELLQQQMRTYREKVAPLPLEDTRQLHAELMEKARKAQPWKA